MAAARPGGSGPSGGEMPEGPGPGSQPSGGPRLAKRPAQAWQQTQPGGPAAWQPQAAGPGPEPGGPAARPAAGGGKSPGPRRPNCPGPGEPSPGPCQIPTAKWPECQPAKTRSLKPEIAKLINGWQMARPGSQPGLKNSLAQVRRPRRPVPGQQPRPRQPQAPAPGPGRTAECPAPGPAPGPSPGPGPSPAGCPAARCPVLANKFPARQNARPKSGPGPTANPQNNAGNA